MYLLSRDDKVTDNGKFQTYRPFQITIADNESALAGFRRPDLAEYLRDVLRLDGEYKPVDIMAIEKDKISDCQLIYVFRTKHDVNRLLRPTSLTMPEQRYVEISSMRPDLG